MARSTITRTFNFTPGTLTLPGTECLDSEENTYYSYDAGCDEEKQCQPAGTYYGTIYVPASDKCAMFVGAIGSGILAAEGVDMSQLATATWTASYSVTANDGYCGVDKAYNSPTFGGDFGESVTVPEPAYLDLMCNSDPWLRVGAGYSVGPIIAVALLSTSNNITNVSVSITVSVNAEMLDVGPSCFWEQLIGTRELC